MKDIKKGFDKKIICTPKFAYLFGYFAADGSFYKDFSGERFEFVDGFSIKNEQCYSLKFIESIQRILLELFEIKAHIRKRQNKYVLSFRNKKLANLFKNEIGQKTGDKSKTINLPSFYYKTNLEKFFWLGFMDGDGCVPRKGRKIALECASKKIIVSFKSFLKRNQVNANYFERKLNNRTYYGVRISSAFFTKYANVLGFLHPRKKLWLNSQIKNNFYVCNSPNIEKFLTKNNYLNYLQIFNPRKVYIVNSKPLLERYGTKCNQSKNKKLKEILDVLLQQGFKNKKILKILSNYRWKMGKGTNVSIRLPLKNNSKLIAITSFVRIRNGGIILSKQYIKVFNKNPNKIIRTCENLFNIRAKWTSKKEPLFCSGVLKLLFSKITIRTEEKYTYPKFYEEVTCKIT